MEDLKPALHSIKNGGSREGTAVYQMDSAVSGGL